MPSKTVKTSHKKISKRLRCNNVISNRKPKLKTLVFLKD